VTAQEQQSAGKLTFTVGIVNDVDPCPGWPSPGRSPATS
jgi:hypothetical protein